MAWVIPDEDEIYLLCLLEDASGIDLGEFCWTDPDSEDGCFRIWDFQWSWYANTDVLQIDQCSRAVGKTMGMLLRTCAFPFAYAGQEKLITAPELNHLRPISDKLEEKFLGIRMLREMLAKTKGNGISRQPQWQARFQNGTRIITRLPNKDGKGVKGVHSAVIEVDEGQDYPTAGWNEIIESRNSWSKNSLFLVHGVSRGVRDKYYEFTQPESGFTVHRYIATYRPSWSDFERQQKTVQYGGSRANIDYRRNIYGEHGDATNPVFVLARLMANVDQDEGSEYNTETYTNVKIVAERILSKDNPNGRPLLSFIDLPGTLLHGHAAAPKGYGAYYGGMDVGMTNHPSEILVVGEQANRQLDLLVRIHLERIHADDQLMVVDHLFEFFGAKLKAFGIDRGGVGFPMSQTLQRRPYGKRVHAWTFSDKVTVGFEDRPLERGETMDDLAIERNVVEHTTDVLRNDIVDPKKILLPFDRELLTEWQGQSYTVVKSSGSAYGTKKRWSEGSFHTLDAMRMLIAAKTLPLLDEMREAQPKQAPVLDVFVGGGW